MMKYKQVIKYFTKELKRELTEEECNIIKISFSLGEQNMFDQMKNEEYSISPPTLILDDIQLSKVEGFTPIETTANNEYLKLAEETNKILLKERGIINEKYGKLINLIERNK